MNITDYQAPDFHKDWLKDIFKKQQALLDKYADIEGMPPLPVSVHTRQGQRWIKDFLWRVTEEMGESYEAAVLMGDSKNPNESGLGKMHHMHMVEELIDALHFIVELIILVGKDWKWARKALDSCPVRPMSRTEAYWLPVYYLGMVGNTLKNKPWKQTEMQTDDVKFYLNLSYAFSALFACLDYLGQDEEEVFKFYSLKNQVNQFRQGSNY